VEPRTDESPDPLAFALTKTQLTPLNRSYAVVSPVDIDVEGAAVDPDAIAAAVNVKMGSGIVRYAGPSDRLKAAYEVGNDVEKFYKKERYQPPSTMESALYKTVDLCLPWCLRAPYGLRKENVLARALTRSGVGFDVLLHSIQSFRVSSVEKDEVAAITGAVMER
jgi:hypothetical protein